MGQIVGEDFSLSRDRAQLLITKEVMRHLKRFHDDTKIVIERNYVDKVYRDSYYTYYASKRTSYGRDAIKLSFFSDVADQIRIDTFKKTDKVTFLEESYRGFIVLRPTPPYIVGRSAIAPNLLKSNSFKTCLAYNAFYSGWFKSLCTGVSLLVTGYRDDQLRGNDDLGTDGILWQ